MLNPGNVLWFWCAEAGKKKYHLCISQDGIFLFVNSPKSRKYTGDFEVDCAEFPFIDPTPSGKSIISCSRTTQKTAAELKALKAELSGKVSIALLKRLFKFIESTPVLSEEEKDQMLAGLGEFL